MALLNQRSTTNKTAQKKNKIKWTKQIEKITMVRGLKCIRCLKIKKKNSIVKQTKATQMPLATTSSRQVKREKKYKLKRNVNRRTTLQSIKM